MRPPSESDTVLLWLGSWIAVAIGEVAPLRMMRAQKFAGRKPGWNTTKLVA